MLGQIRRDQLSCVPLGKQHMRRAVLSTAIRMLNFMHDSSRCKKEEEW